MIKTIIFDLGGVIVPFDFKRGYARIEALCGCPAAEIPVRLRSTDLVTRFELGQVAPQQFVNELSRTLGLNTTYEQFCDLWTSIFLPDTLIPETFIEKLRQRHRLLLLSNTNSIHFEMIRREYPLIRHFHHKVLSYEVGAMKPQREIYAHALRHADCLPEECIFIDDLLPNVEAAKAEGIDGVHFRSFALLQTDLRERGIA
jgi:putative hydrolase of the HAD superfamily